MQVAKRTISAGVGTVKARANKGQAQKEAKNEKPTPTIMHYVYGGGVRFSSGPVSCVVCVLIV